MSTHSTVILEAVMRLLQPLIRILLRQGISCGTFTELAKRAYVDVAEKEFTVAGRKQTTSRISVLTGMHRKEVLRLKLLPPIEESGIDEHYNRAARVISGWLRDEAFQDRKGDPDVLPYEGGDHSFTELVKRYSGDIPTRAVADELLRVNAIEKTQHGELRLTARGYVTSGSEMEKFQILGTDTRDLILTIDHNLIHPPDKALFQRKVMYDNVPLENVEGFQRLAARLGQGVLEQLDAWLAARDKDVNPQVAGNGRARLGLGIYQLKEILNDQEVTTARKKTGRSS